MNRFKFKAFRDEFPFIPNADPTRINDIRVKRADENLLSGVPEDSGYDCFAGQRWSRTDISFVLEDGVVMEDCVLHSKDWDYAANHTPRSQSAGESVLESIARHGVADSLKFILEDHTSGCDFDDTPTYRGFVVYKTPKGDTFSDLVYKSEEVAARDVQAAIMLTDEPVGDLTHVEVGS